MRYFYLVFVAALLAFSCKHSTTSKKGVSEEIIDSTEISNQHTTELENNNKKEDVTLQKLLSKLLNEHKFDDAKSIIEKNKIDINDFSEISRDRRYIRAKRILPEIMAYSCDPGIIKFLLSQNSDPNLPSINVIIPEYSGEEIPADFDIENNNLTYYQDQGYLSKQFPLYESLRCDDSTSFYLLINSGANQNNYILRGAIKWSDTLLIKKMTAKGVTVNFVPRTNDVEILKFLISITDGKQFGKIEYGEGGDMFESNLMYACQAGEKELVWFMLETGADPNGCLPTNSDKNGNYINVDENGFYPAITALSIAREKYKLNIELSERREDSSLFIKKAQDYEEIVTLLKKYGAKEIEKCLGP